MPADSPAPERPRQVTLAGWLIVAGSVFVVLSAFERMSTLHSLETQEAIAEFLSRPPGDALGLTRDGAQSLLRLLAMVAGGAAAASAILGYHVLRRSRAARVTLSVLALPLLIAGSSVFGFLAALVVVAIVMLWLQPARDWFNGVPVPAATPRPAAQTDVTSHGAPLETAGPAAAAPTTARRPHTPRPAAVTGACVITWVVCGLIALLMAATFLVLIAAPDTFFDELRRQDPDLGGSGMSESQIRTTGIVASAVSGIWCLAAIGFAAAAFSGYRWGWVALVVSAAAAGLVSALVMLGSIGLLVPMVAAAVAVGLLVRAESRAWCRRTVRRRGSVSS